MPKDIGACRWCPRPNGKVGFLTTCYDILGSRVFPVAGDHSLRLKNGCVQDDASVRAELHHYGNLRPIAWR
jgi:hypothetical protein